MNRTLLEIPIKSEIEDEIALLQKQGIRHLLHSDPDYPLMLSHIGDLPASALYTR